MNKFLSATLLSLLIITAMVVTVSATFSVCVKKGDWIEYNVSTTGNPGEHDAKWSRMEVTRCTGRNHLDLNITTQAVLAVNIILGYNCVE
jgi:hypothetical protein